ncbi:hypothetical protein ACFTRD_14360 [Paenibacillus sp. NPDC056933]|uniref:hypothetical protein n=1 Tax=Paenibacillus sp. NPDC056933 TaxID=3345968 RepID=UPI003642C06B
MIIKKVLPQVSVIGDLRFFGMVSIPAGQEGVTSFYATGRGEKLDFGWGTNWTLDCSVSTSSWLGLKHTYR